MSANITFRLLGFGLCLVLWNPLACGQTKANFQLTDIPPGLQKAFVGIRGDQAPLSWEKSIPLTRQGGHFVISIDFPQDLERVAFKFVLYDEDQNPLWEGIENRSLDLGTESEVTYEGQWDEPAFIDPNTLAKLQPNALREDFELIKTMLLEVHPGLYRYNSQTSIQAALDALEAAFAQPLTHGEAYLAISKLLASLQCGHTFASFYNQNGLIKSVIHRQVDKLPFTFTWIEDRMFVQYDATADQVLRNGVEVLKINGQEVQAILAALLPYVSSDGGGRASRVAHLAVHAYDFRYDAFDVFYPLVFPLEQPIWELEVQFPGANQRQILQVAAVTRRDRHQTLVQRFPSFPKDRNALLSYRITPEQVGVLRLGSFGLMGWKRLTIDYKAFYQEAFAAFAQQGVEDLVIDIRDNVGGNDEMKDELATYFDIDRFIDKDREGRTRYLRFPESLKPYIQTWGDPWYYDLSKDQPKQKEGYYIFPRSHRVNQKNKKKPEVFTGKIYLLTSAQNNSLAYYLAKDFKSFELGTSLGQETDGNLRGINGGQILFLRLPHSEIEIDFPVMGDFSLSPQPDRGVVPHIPIMPKVEDAKRGIDTEMAYVLRYIREKTLRKKD